MSNRNNSKNTLAKTAFFTFIIVAIAYLVQAILAILVPHTNSDIVNLMKQAIDIIQKVVLVLLFIITGILGWRYCKYRSTLEKVFYFICVILVLLAFVLPILPAF